MSKEKYGFVYIWYDRKHKRYYIGCHWGHENDGYICSSSWMMKAYKRRPQDYWHQYDEKVKTIGEKISAAKKGKSTGPCSEETKRKISESNRGKVRTSEHLENMSKAQKGRVSPNKGKKMSEEQKEHLRQVNLGKKLSEEHRRKISEAGKGRIISEETRKKLSKSNKGCKGRAGQKLSEEHKKKISEAAKRRHASR
jgi:hypothetical protein